MESTFKKVKVMHDMAKLQNTRNEIKGQLGYSGRCSANLKAQTQQKVKQSWALPCASPSRSQNRHEITKSGVRVMTING